MYREGGFMLCTRKELILELLYGAYCSNQVNQKCVESAERKMQRDVYMVTYVLTYNPHGHCNVFRCIIDAEKFLKNLVLIRSLLLCSNSFLMP